MKRLITFITFLVLAVAAAGTVMASDSNFNLLQNRYYSPNPKATRTVTTNYTATAADHMINCNTTSGAITITLPPIINTLGSNGASYIIRNIGVTGYAVTVTASTTDIQSNTIGGVASRTLYSPISGSTSTMLVKVGIGRDWIVDWETAPMIVDMFGGEGLHANQGAFAQEIVSIPTVSTTLTYQDCGSTIGVGTDALTFTLPSAVALGCHFKFINIGAAGHNILDIIPASTDNFSGSILKINGLNLISSTTGSTLSNTKSTAQPGDTVELITMATGSWIISYGTGTWALK